MVILETLDPEFLRRVLEQANLYLSNLARLSFDDLSRLRARVEHVDDGYVRVRDAQDTSISLVEILRHMTWSTLSVAQLGATTAQPGEGPPPSVVTVGGWDGSLVRMLRTDAEGRPQVVVVSLPNPPNLDVALSTRASESTLSSILGRLDVALSTRASEATLAAVRDRLPSSLTSAGNLRTAIMEDAVGIARESTLSSILGRLDVALSTRASESTLVAVRDRLPSSLTTAGNLKTAIMEDAVGLARNSTVAAVRDRLPSSLTSAGNLRVAVMEDVAGLSRPPSLTSPADAETYTTTPLAANAAYYGPTRDFSASRLAAMGVMGYADQPSAIDGVYIQLSLDGVNWDYRGATATLPAAGAVSLCQIVTARYARAVWVNGATAQTVFRFGGRYMIAGSENPPLSPVVDYPEVAVCSVCSADRTETGDFFAERAGVWVVYCPKCYANKRWR
ncbi:MAG: hypothetical protein QXU64_02340, partial [Thermofilaceae archaeon]